MSATPLFQKVDAVTVPVPDLDTGLRFYRDALGHELRWRNNDTGQAGLALPGSDTEIVLSTRERYEPDWLVVAAVIALGGALAAAAFIRPGPGSRRASPPAADAKCRS